MLCKLEVYNKNAYGFTIRSPLEYPNLNNVDDYGCSDDGDEEDDDTSVPGIINKSPASVVPVTKNIIVMALHGVGGACGSSVLLS